MLPVSSASAHFPEIVPPPPPPARSFSEKTHASQWLTSSLISKSSNNVQQPLLVPKLPPRIARSRSSTSPFSSSESSSDGVMTVSRSQVSSDGTASSVSGRSSTGPGDDRSRTSELILHNKNNRTCAVQGRNKNNYINAKKCNMSQSQYSLSQSSYLMDDENWYSELVMKPEEFKNYKIKRSSTFNSDCDLVASPSPSDSGITELEAILQEKESEIRLLRETLEQNEQVIFKVYEEKEQSWRKEFQKLRSQFEASLTLYRQQVVRAEAKLAAANQQEVTEKRRLELQVEDYKSMNNFLEDRVNCMNKEMSILKNELLESEWTLRQKSQELTLLQSQIKDGNQESKSSEVLVLRGQLNETQNLAESKTKTAFEMQEKLRSSSLEFSDFKENFGRSLKLLQDQINELLEERKRKDSLIDSLKEDNVELRYQLGNVREELSTTKEGIEEERSQWNDEKEKVIRYQKKLNSNYVCILKKNKELEHELKRARNQYKINVNSSTSVEC